jgi:hypothetical protein
MKTLRTLVNFVHVQGSCQNWMIILTLAELSDDINEGWIKRQDLFAKCGFTMSESGQRTLVGRMKALGLVRARRVGKTLHELALTPDAARIIQRAYELISNINPPIL